MRLISVDALKGMEKLDMAIRKGNGAVLLPAGAILTDNFKRKLKNLGILNVYIEDDLFSDAIATPALDQDTKAEAVQKMTQVFQNLKRGRDLDINSVNAVKKSIYESVYKVMHLPLNIVDMYVIENEKVLHAVNTATMVAAVGSHAELASNVVESLIVAALLHDMQLEDMYGIEPESHVEEAFKILKNSRTVSNISFMTVDMHHEKYDGSGYPRRLKADNIYIGARILAICDMYDNLVYGYSGLDRLKHYHALEYINAHAASLFDPTLLKIFNSSIAIYPNGSTVWLNNGKQAIVIMQNKIMPARPIIKFTEPIEGLYYELDLLKDNTVFIETLDN